MNHEAGFLAAIAATPGDAAVRLVYADWLEEHGRPGPEFLRTEQALANLPLGTPDWSDAFARYSNLRRHLPADRCEVVGIRPLNQWLATAVRGAWARLEGWCQGRHPALLEALNSGASPGELGELDDIERVLGRPLPADVLESLAIHNGGCWFLFGNDLLTTSRIVETWQMWRGLEDMNEELRVGMTSYPDDAIELAYTIPGWVPLTSDFGGNYIGVDLTPGATGTAGQVINFGRNEGHKCVLAPGWAEFLADYAGFLESGAVTEIDPDPDNWGECFRVPFGDRHYHDVLRAWRKQGRWPLRRLPPAR